MSKMTNKQLKNIVAFVALMQNGEGILGKSPDYIAEKFNAYARHDKADMTHWGLDIERKRIVEEWLKRWAIKID